MVGAKPAQAVVDRLPYVLRAAVVRDLAGRGIRAGSRTTKPTFVASTARARCPPVSARPTSSSLVNGPYASAVSIKVMPRSSAWRITAIDVASSRGVSMS